MAEGHDLQLQSAISAINDVVSRIDSLYDPSKIGSIKLRLDFIDRMLVSLEVTDDVVNTMFRLHDKSTKRIEARYNSHTSAHSYQPSFDITGWRGRPTFTINFFFKGKPQI